MKSGFYYRHKPSHHRNIKRKQAIISICEIIEKKENCYVYGFCLSLYLSDPNLTAILSSLVAFRSHGSCCSAFQDNYPYLPVDTFPVLQPETREHHPFS